MNTRHIFTVLLLAGGLAFTGCSKTKETLGLTRTAPDEFAVVSRAPLELPPEYTLRPPRPGAPRPQEASVYEQSRNVVFGENTQAAQDTPDSGEAVLLQKAGAGQSDPAIRVIVDAEYEASLDENKPVTEKLLGLKLGDKDKNEIIDPAHEKRRLSNGPLKPPADETKQQNAE